MASRRAKTALLALAACGLVGCRAGGLGNLARPEPPIAARTDPSVERIVAHLNQNAHLVQTLKASPTITVSADHRNHPLNGKLAMSRPRNFRLELRTPVTSGREADIGSNSDGFWFWVARSEEKKVYVARYDESGASPLAAAFQPDWIVEALGLREIPEEESRTITVERGSGADAGRLSLTRRQRAQNGQVYTRMMIVDEAKGLVREHRLYEGDKKVLLAKASIPPGAYVAAKLPERDPNSSTGGGGVVILPSQIRLEWMREQLALDVSLGRPQVNGTLSDELFVEPEFRGYARIDMSEQPGLANGPTTIRETRPAPPAGVQLQRPEPLRASGADASPSNPWPAPPDPAAAANDRVIGAPWPTAPTPAFLRPGATGWARVAEREYEP
jgi:hypothetical protein